MTNLAHLSRIALALTSLTCLILLMLDLAGWIPDRADQTDEARVQLTNAIVTQATLSVMMDDLSEVRALLEVSTRRNPDVESVGLRDRNGRLLMATRDHDAFWSGVPAEGSSARYRRMPIFKEGSHWAMLEISFAPVATHSLPEMVLGRPAARLILAVGVLGFAANFLLMRRILRHLDPSEVVPARVQTALDVMSDGVLLIDRDERIVVANKTFCELLGRGSASLIGLAASSLEWLEGDRLASQDALPWLHAIEHAETRKDLPLSVLVGKERTLVEFRVSGSPIVDGWERAKGAIITFRDVTDLERQRRELEQTLVELEKSQFEIRLQNEELEHLAQTDALTGIANRGTFMARFERQFAESVAARESLCCLMVDIDHFKKVNDEHGHAAGDEVIRAVAEALTRQTRDSDLVGRYGGEEFCVALPGLDPNIAMDVAERIRSGIAAPGFARVATSVSIGVSCSRFGAATPAGLIDEADQSLYASKKGGRNRVTRFDGIDGVPDAAA